MPHAEGYAVVLLQRLGDVDRGRPVVLQLLERALRVDHEGIHHGIHGNDRAHRLREEGEFGRRLLVVAHAGRDVVGAQAHRVRKADDG